MSNPASPWDDLPPYESERIAALPFDEMIAALCEHAPKSSSGDIVAELGNSVTKRAVREARDKWKAARTPGEEKPFVPIVPTREAIIEAMGRAIEARSAAEVMRWANSLVALSRAGNVDATPETTEEWDRLSDMEAGVLIALTRKLNGETLTAADDGWIARLR